MSKGASRSCSAPASLVLVINILTMTLSSVAFALSLWTIAAPSSLVHVVQLFGTPLLKALVTEDTLSVQIGFGVAMLSGFFFCISLMGCYGVVTGSQFLLFMYATLVVLLLLLECALVFYFSSNIVQKGIRAEGPVTDVLRLSLRCCGTNYTSVSGPVTPPWSCCGLESYPNNCTLDRIYQQDCQRAVMGFLQKYEVIVYASLAVSHVLVSVCSLVRRASSAAQRYS